MSHYMYSNKKMIVTSDDKIFFACEVADSSVTDWTGRKHPKHWANISFDECTKSLLMPRAKYMERVKQMISDEIAKMQAYYDSEGNGRIATEDTFNYSGNSYNGNRKIRSMRYFFSAARPVPVKEFFRNWDIVLKLAIYGKDKEMFSKHNGEIICITSEQDLVEADKYILKLREEASALGDIEVLYYTTVRQISHQF